MTLGEKLLALRSERKLSQGDLAEQLEVSRQSVSKWETDQSVPELDKIIKLADLFGVSVDELVREEARPQPPEPRVVYVERGPSPGLTAAQKAGVVFEGIGVAMIVIGFLGLGFLILVGAALLILGLPLLLARKHPWLVMGWLLVGISLLILNPYTGSAPWGLIGGLRLLYAFIVLPEIRYRSAVLSIAIGITRGLLTLLLLYFTWRAWKNRKNPQKDG